MKTKLITAVLSIVFVCTLSLVSFAAVVPLPSGSPVVSGRFLPSDLMKSSFSATGYINSSSQGTIGVNIDVNMQYLSSGTTFFQRPYDVYWYMLDRDDIIVREITNMYKSPVMINKLDFSTYDYYFSQHVDVYLQSTDTNMVPRCLISPIYMYADGTYEVDTVHSFDKAPSTNSSLIDNQVWLAFRFTMDYTMVKSDWIPVGASFVGFHYYYTLSPNTLKPLPGGTRFHYSGIDYYGYYKNTSETVAIENATTIINNTIIEQNEKTLEKMDEMMDTEIDGSAELVGKGDAIGGDVTDLDGQMSKIGDIGGSSVNDAISGLGVLGTDASVISCMGWISSVVSSIIDHEPLEKAVLYLGLTCGCLVTIVGIGGRVASSLRYRQMRFGSVKNDPKANRRG